MGNPQPTRPVILLIDEIETAISAAERNSEIRSDSVSLARNRPALLHVLDRLGMTCYVIVLATTNRRPDELEAAYIREGRFDRHVEVSAETGSAVGGGDHPGAALSGGLRARTPR